MHKYISCTSLHAFLLACLHVCYTCVWNIFEKLLTSGSHCSINPDTLSTVHCQQVSWFNKARHICHPLPTAFTDVWVLLLVYLKTKQTKRKTAKKPCCLLAFLSPPSSSIYVFMASHFCTSLQKYSFERMDQLRQFQNLIQATSREIMWINDCEEEELLYDWSDRNTDIARKQESFSVRQLNLPMLPISPLLE